MYSFCLGIGVIASFGYEKDEITKSSNSGCVPVNNREYVYAV